jgi:hypothetical protein
LSERIGDATILIETINNTFGHSRQIGGGPNSPDSRSYSRSTTTAPHGRRVLLPNEILNLPDSLGLLFHKNMHVIPIRLARYYNAREFAERRRGSGIRGTGQRGGLGFFTGVRAVAALAMAIFFAVAMAALTEPPAARPAAWRPTSNMGHPPIRTPGGHANAPSLPNTRLNGSYRPLPSSRRR